MREAGKTKTGRDAFHRVPLSPHDFAKTETRWNASLPGQSFALLALVALAGLLHAADYPAPTEGDYRIRDFRFAAGETLPEVRMHYRTLGKPVRDKDGIVRNAVLILHGTTGSGAQFMRPEFAG